MLQIYLLLDKQLFTLPHASFFTQVLLYNPKIKNKKQQENQKKKSNAFYLIIKNGIKIVGGIV